MLAGVRSQVARGTGVVAMLLVLLLAGSFSWTPARADAAGIEIIKSEVVSEFPDGIRFRLEARSDTPIEEVVVRFEVDGRAARQYNYLKLDKSSGEVTGEGILVMGEYYHRTNSRDRYSPPGTALTYWYELIDENGETFTTEPAEFIYMDARFDWETKQAGPVTVFYHGPVDVRAKTMAETAYETIQFMGALLGTDVVSALRIVMYNNAAEMIGALPPRSTTISRELITEGQAFAAQNVVLLMGNGRRAKGTVSHELTHVLVNRATESAVGSVPLWLNEGLAEFGNVDQGIAYDRFLEWAVDTDRVIPLMALNVFPGDPNLVLVSYGQAKSVIEYMVVNWGPAKMAELLATYNAGGSFEGALQSVYGVTVRELDARWREIVGADPFEERRATRGTAALPTAEPTKAALLPYTFDSLAEAGASPTPESAPTVAPESESPATPSPEPTPAESPKPEPLATAAPEPTPGQPESARSSGGCSAPAHPGAPVDASSAALVLFPLLGAAWAAVRRLRR